MFDYGEKYVSIFYWKLILYILIAKDNKVTAITGSRVDRAKRPVTGHILAINNHVLRGGIQAKAPQVLIF